MESIRPQAKVLILLDGEIDQSFPTQIVGRLVS
jgi:hypothetical protein